MARIREQPIFIRRNMDNWTLEILKEVNKEMVLTGDNGTARYKLLEEYWSQAVSIAEKVAVLFMDE